MKDRFSKGAADYARFRPGYPEELFKFILAQVRGRESAWDCGTGNGQTARELAPQFTRVFATDISAEQLRHAHRAENIHYSEQPAEQTRFPDNYFDLVTVSQALHWFRLGAFYSEVKRVARPESWIAAWTYSLLRISPEIDELVNLQHYRNVLGAYWDAERKFVDEQYRTLPFPFREISTPEFEIRLAWTLDELRGYLETWSALKKFVAAGNENPVPALMDRVAKFWSGERMPVTFPVHLRMGQILK